MTVEDKLGVLSMTALDMDEIRAHVARKDLAYALLASQCEDRVSAVALENEALRQKLSQMEILLKGRQSALLAKEQECANLRRTRQKPFCSVYAHAIFSLNPPPSPPSPRRTPWLSVTSHLMTMNITGPSTASESAQTDEKIKSCEDSPPPPTVYRKDRRVAVSYSSSSSESPKQTRVRRSLDRYRESFASVRSSIGVKSVKSDDSDASLDELVSNAMRLSRTSLSSARSSTSSSVVRGSVVVRESLQSVFPKRWK